jgi:hypothetical protein
VGEQDKNATDVLDRAAQDVKARYVHLTSRAGGDGKKQFEQAILAHNNSIITSIHGTPNDVSKNPNLQFMNLVDKAKRFEHNTRLLEKHTAQLEDLGTFRTPPPGATKNKFLRGNQAPYGEVQTAGRIEGSTAIASDGSRADIKLVKAVQGETTATQDVATENKRTDRKKKDPLPVAEALHERLGDRETSLSAASRHHTNTGP